MVSQLDEQREGTSEYGRSLNVKPSSTPESLRANNKVQSQLKRNSCSKDTRKGDLSQTLVLDSTSNDVALSPYWNERCQELQSSLFLPHQTELLDLDSRSLRNSLNYMEVQSNFWRKTFTPKDLMCKPSLAFSRASVTPRAERELVGVAKKIRVYPSDPRKVDQQIDACRRAYNLCVATYRAWSKGDVPTDFTKLRRDVREQVRQEASELCITSLDEACQEAKRANQAVIRKRTKGLKASLQFRKKTTTKQGFIYQKMSSLGLPRVLGSLHLTEELPDGSVGKQARLIREWGRYFLITKRSILIAEPKNHGNAVSIDPGVRTFATTYSQEQSTKMGEGFQLDELRPLGVRLDKLYSRRAKLFNRWSKLPGQLREDLLRCFTKKINKLKQRRSDLVEDLHKRICYWLVTTYDFIFLPTFKVKQMTSKEKRKIGSKVVRSMMDLCHYKFKQMLTWMCRKYGKTLVIVNEAYTTQTRSWDGIRQRVGSQKTISDGFIRVDRDINGARGIFLRAITR